MLPERGSGIAAHLCGCASRAGFRLQFVTGGSNLSIDRVSAVKSTMIRRIFSTFLVFLVFSAWADDIWAAATPDPDDDILASQDNDFLPSVRREQFKAPPEDEVPIAYGLKCTTGCASAEVPSLVQFHCKASFPPFIADVLRTLMSFQC